MFAFFTRRQRQLDRIEAMLVSILSSATTSKEIFMTVSAELQKVADDAAAQTTTIDSVAVMVTGLVAQLQAAAGDKDATLAIAATLEANTSKLHDLVVANTTDPTTGTPIPAPADTTLASPA